MPQRETSHNIGAARNRLQPRPRRRDAIKIIVRRRRQRRAGRQHRAQRSQIAPARNLAARFFERAQILRAHARDGDFFARRDIPKRFAIRQKRIAIEQHNRRPRRQRRNQPIPHHPAASRVIQNPLAAPQIDMQKMLFEMLQQRPADAVRDAFGLAGGAGRIQNPQRIVKPASGIARRNFGGDGFGVKIDSPRGEKIAPRGAARAGIGFDHNQIFDRAAFVVDSRQRGAQFFAQIENLAAVSTAIGDEQNLGRDLRKAIRYGGGAEIGRAAAPNRAARRRRQHRRHGLDAVWQNAGDAVAFADPQRAQKIRPPPRPRRATAQKCAFAARRFRRRRQSRFRRRRPAADFARNLKSNPKKIARAQNRPRRAKPNRLGESIRSRIRPPTKTKTGADFRPPSGANRRKSANRNRRGRMPRARKPLSARCRYRRLPDAKRFAPSSPPALSLLRSQPRRQQLQPMRDRRRRFGAQMQKAADVGCGDDGRRGRAQNAHFVFAQTARRARAQNRMRPGRAATQIRIGDRQDLESRAAQNRLHPTAAFERVLQSARRVKRDSVLPVGGRRRLDSGRDIVPHALDKIDIRKRVARRQGGVLVARQALAESARSSPRKRWKR